MLPVQNMDLEPYSMLQLTIMEITVRPATHQDIEFLVHGNAQMALDTENLSLDMDRLRRGVHAVFDDPSRGFYLIAEVNGATAGQMMITYEWSDWRNGVFWWIQSVYTAPEFRRRGVFYALYTQAEAHNLQAQATYRRCGMHETAYRLFEVDNVIPRSIPRSE